jgi:predicted aspartyl protease
MNNSIGSLPMHKIERSISTRRLRTILSVVALLAVACLPALADDKPELCETHDWFQLREQVAHGNASLLCKGAVDATFERRAAAERELKAVIQQQPHSASSYRAHELLVNMYFRDGQYRRALAQLDQMLVERPSAEDAKAVHSMFSVFAQYPDLTVASSRPATVRSENLENNIFVPVTVNGVGGTYIVDTGANHSAMCESEARRLGLKVEETTAKTSDISGTAAAVRVTEAADLWIGKTHLKNIAFAVFPDANEPFVDLPEGHKGVLGISVLIALGTFRIDKENHFEILPHPSPASVKEIPLAFDGMGAVSQMSLDGKTLNFTFDTGGDRTYLYPAFAAAFPELMRTGTKKDHKLIGVNGSTTQESIELPSVRFLFGREVELAPATVLLKTTTGASEWAAGNLGFDLVLQTLPITINFRAMQLRFEDR